MLRDDSLAGEGINLTENTFSVNYSSLQKLLKYFHIRDFLILILSHQEANIRTHQEKVILMA